MKQCKRDVGSKRGSGNVFRDLGHETVSVTLPPKKPPPHATPSANQRRAWPGADSLVSPTLDPLRKAAIAAGIGPEIGWHTFRHTVRSWLDATGAPLKVQQELMRHASITTTMNVYGRAMPSIKREANSKVVSMVLKREKGEPAELAPQAVSS